MTPTCGRCGQEMLVFERDALSTVWLCPLDDEVVTTATLCICGHAIERHEGAPVYVRHPRDGRHCDVKGCACWRFAAAEAA